MLRVFPPSIAAYALTRAVKLDRLLRRKHVTVQLRVFENKIIVRLLEFRPKFLKDAQSVKPGHRGQHTVEKERWIRILVNMLCLSPSDKPANTVDGWLLSWGTPFIQFRGPKMEQKWNPRQSPWEAHARTWLKNWKSGPRRIPNQPPLTQPSSPLFLEHSKGKVGRMTFKVKTLNLEHGMHLPRSQAKTLLNKRGEIFGT